MKTTTVEKQTEEAGSAIVLVILILATLMIIVGIAVEYTSVIARNVQRGNTLESAVAIADGCIENNFAYWREACRAQTNTVLTTSDLANLTLPAQAQFPNVPNFTVTRNNYDSASTATVQQCKVIAVDPQLNAMGNTTSPTGGFGPSDKTVNYSYLATAFVTLPALKGNLVAKVQRVFQKELVSPWNYAIFYIDPLEIHPGPDFWVTGMVHTNSTLYTGHNTLHFMDKVTYTSDWVHGSGAGSNGFKPGDPRALGGSAYEIPTEPTYVAGKPPALDVAHQPFGLDSQLIFNTLDANQNNDSYHELIEQPSAGVDVLASQRYWDQASIVIEVWNDNSIHYGKPDPVTGALTPLTSASTGQDKQLYNMFNGAVTTNQPIQDNREGGSVRLATLDISKLYRSDKKWAANNFNGVVFVQDRSALPLPVNGGPPDGLGLRRGIRLINGNVIPNGGLTVASSNPVYIQGDFNTGIGTPPSNYTSGNDPTMPQVSGYTRQPCSVLADAVNILSNNWNDANAATLSARVATNTTVNTAIVSGIVPTAANQYSGGAENFPRFLEAWDQNNTTFTYYGSMVELYQSKQATGVFKMPGISNIYQAPIRQWYFDNNFKTLTPPGSLSVISYTKGRWTLVP